MDNEQARVELTYIFADTGLAEELQQFELSQCAQAKHGMVKRCDLLDCNFATAGPVNGGANDAICPLANYIKNLVLGTYVKLFRRSKANIKLRTAISPTLNRTLRGAGCVVDA